MKMTRTSSRLEELEKDREQKQSLACLPLEKDQDEPKYMAYCAERGPHKRMFSKVFQS
jgi:hypothetical protein